MSLIFLINYNFIISQTQKHTYQEKYFLKINFGYQVSGIKDEDFVISNYSPLFIFSFGKWFSRTIGFQVGYRGFYFNYIGDDFKHYYDYYFVEGLFDLLSIYYKYNENNLQIILNGGIGYFYNHFYKKPNLCGSMGFNNKINILNQVSFDFDLNSVFGWDIYQGNKDILPGVTIGLTYKF